MNYIFGLDSYSLAIISESSSDSILKVVNTLSSINIGIKSKNMLINNQLLTFRIRVNRVYKKFLFTTKNFEVLLADSVLLNFSTALKVNLNKADISIFCEIHKLFSYIFDTIIKVQSGLPINYNSSALILLSGGFDSSVAAYKTMRRGVSIDYICFHSYPLTSLAIIEKIKNIVKILNRYQGNGKIFICNILEIQRIILTNVLESYRTIHYRRIMLKIAEMIALMNNNKILITGDSIGQVASQTVTNLDAMNNSTKMLVLRPVITMNKEEIINIAKQIDINDIAKQQLLESCTAFLPKNPSTSVDKIKLMQYESKLNLKKLLKIAYKNTIIYDLILNKEYKLNEFFKQNKE